MGRDGFFKVRELKKADYVQFKALVKEYTLDDDRELMVVMVHVMTALAGLTDGNGNSLGKGIIMSCIDTVRASG